METVQKPIMRVRTFNILGVRRVTLGTVMEEKIWTYPPGHVRTQEQDVRVKALLRTLAEKRGIKRDDGDKEVEPPQNLGTVFAEKTLPLIDVPGELAELRKAGVGAKLPGPIKLWMILSRALKDRTDTQTEHIDKDGRPYARPDRVRGHVRDKYPDDARFFSAVLHFPFGEFDEFTTKRVQTPIDGWRHTRKAMPSDRVNLIVEIPPQDLPKIEIVQ